MKKRRLVSALLVVIFVLFALSIPGAADSTAPDDGEEVNLSTKAGAHGSYYVSEDGVKTYIPPDATLEECGIDIEEEIAKAEAEAENQPSLAEFDPEMEAIAQQYFATNRATTKRFAIGTPSGYEKSTCLLLTRFVEGDDGVAVGTGWLINNNYLVTAGHMVYDYNFRFSPNDGEMMHMAIYVGANNGERVHYSLSGAYHVGYDYNCVTDDSGYTSRGRWDDWAVVQLKSPIKTPVSKLTLGKANSLTDMAGKSYTTQGYPGDLNAGKAFWKYTMYKQNGGTINYKYPAPKVLDLVGSSNIEFEPGQSGSAIYTSGVAQAIGIGRGPSDDTSLEDGRACFVLINNWLYNFLNNNYM